MDAGLQEMTAEHGWLPATNGKIMVLRGRKKEVPSTIFFQQ
jgi:hypothetical protein